MAYDDDEDDDDEAHDNADNQVRVNVARSIDITPAVESEIQTLKFASQLGEANLDKEAVDRGVSRGGTASKTVAAGQTRFIEVCADGELECAMSRDVQGQMDQNLVGGVYPSKKSRQTTDATPKTRLHVDQKLNGKKSLTVARKSTRQIVPIESSAIAATTSARVDKSCHAFSWKWCTVKIEGRNDDYPLPGMLFADAGNFLRDLVLPHKKTAADYYAVKFLGALGKAKTGDIFLVEKNSSKVIVTSSMECVTRACSQVLTSKPIKASSVVLGPSLVMKEIPKEFRDITDKNDDREGCLAKLRTRPRSLLWFDGDVYVYSQPPRHGETISKDCYFVRIDRTTGSMICFQNCDAVGAYKPGCDTKKLRSVKAATLALEANRKMILELRQCWKKFKKFTGNKNDVSETLEKLNYDASRVHLGMYEESALLQASSGKVSKAVEARKGSVSKPLSEEKPEKRQYNKKKRADDSALDSTAKKSVKRRRASETLESTKQWGGGTPPRVVVIGAGPAGLSAARCLKEHGIEDVVILESRDRPGGRCHTMTMPALPLYDLPSIDVDLGASFVHGCHDYNPLFVIAKKNKVVLNTAGGGYSAGWGEKAPWYNAIDGGRVKEKTVTHAFKLAQKVSERMFKVNGSTDDIDLLCSSSPNVSTPSYDDHKSSAEGLARALTENLNQLHSDSRLHSSRNILSLNAAFSEAKFDAMVSTSNHKSTNEVGKGTRDCSLQVAFDCATSSILQSLLNGEKRMEVLRPVYDCIPTVTWAYVAPMEDLSFQVQREFNNEVADAAEQLAQDVPQITTADKDNLLLDARDSEVEKPIDLSDGMVVNGYKNLLIDRVIGSGKNTLNIKYMSRVNEVNVKTTGKGVACVVKCADGFKKECDYVIVTVPLGVLKNKVIKFTPSLSHEKTEAIEMMGMGTENKVYMRFHEMFWPTRFRFIQCTDKRFRFLNLDMYGKKNTLLVHVSPPYAATFNGKSDDNDVVKEICKLCKTMFKLKETPEPVFAHVTRWGQDVHAYGAYSYMPIGSTTQHVAALAKSEYDGRVYFAGEACSVEGAQCVHGAVLTGNAAAVSILGLGNVDIDEDKIVGESAGLQLESSVHSVQCSKCKRWRVRPVVVDDQDEDDSSEWQCRQGGKWNTRLGTLGCAYR